MLTIHNVQSQKYVVMGLGLSGISTCKALIQSGAQVLAWDDSPTTRQAALDQGIQLSSVDQIVWDNVTALILAPGIPHDLPQPHVFAIKALAANIPIICDVELLVANQSAAKFIGITGSNGKSTTTALINHVLTSLKRPVQMGGNIGIPVCDLALLNSDETYVLELSSFHLERMPSINMDIAVLTNIAADHLDRHGDMVRYVAAKQHIFHTHGKIQTAVISYDDEYSRTIYTALKHSSYHKCIAISTTTHVAGGLSIKDDHLVDDVFESARSMFDLREFNCLKGRHNWQNALCAYAALRSLNIATHDIYQAFLTFESLPHRMRSLGFIDQVEFINDSKATNPDAVGHALAAYDNIYWILGGVAKESLLDGLDVYYPKIKQAFVIGQAAPQFDQILSSHLPVLMCESLQQAMERALQQAQNDSQAVILLSPACASYDQFKNFEQRGFEFERIYDNLKRHHQTNLDHHL